MGFQTCSLDTTDKNSYTSAFNDWLAKFHPFNNGVQTPNTWDNGFLGSNAFSNSLQGLGVGMNLFNGIQGYRMGKQYLNMAKDNLAFQKDQFNETYNNSLRQYNAGLADRLRARAAFETGDSNAYNDEISANSLQRGMNGDLAYKRSENAV